MASHQLTFSLFKGGPLVTRVDVRGLNYCKLIETVNFVLVCLCNADLSISTRVV